MAKANPFMKGGKGKSAPKGDDEMPKDKKPFPPSSKKKKAPKKGY